MLLDLETVAKTFALWKRSGWYVPPEIDGEAVRWWLAVLQTERVTNRELEQIALIASKRLKRWPTTEDAIKFVAEIRESNRLNALANHVEAIDGDGSRVLVHRSRVHNGHVVPLGAPANGVDINNVPALMPSSRKEILDGMTEGGKRMLAQLLTNGQTEGQK